MAVELPEPLQWVLLLLAGCRWPEADEDQLRDMADHCRKAADSLKDAAQSADATVKRALEGQQGVAAEALGKYWEKYSVGKGTEQDPGYLPGAINALNGMGDMLEQVANSAETAKIQIIAQLGILAFEIATAEAEAPFTAGASMLEVPVFIAASKTTVSASLKLLLKEMIEMAVKQAAQMAAINLLAQGIELAEGHRKSIDMKEVGMSAAGGAVGGASGHLIGKGIGKAGEKLGVEAALKTTGGKMATGAAVGVGADVSTQLITTGTVDGNSLLGSGLSGGAGAGLHAGASKVKGHLATPKAAEAPKLPGAGAGAGAGSGEHGGTPSFNKSDTSTGASAYHGPSGGSGSSGSSGASGTSGASHTADSGSPSGSSGAGAAASHEAGSGAGADAGASKVSGLTPFGAGRGGDAPSAGSSSAERNVAPTPSHESAPAAAPATAPREQAGTHVQESMAPRTESTPQSVPRQESVAPAQENVAPRTESQPAAPVHESTPRSVPRQESVAPVHENATPRVESQPTAPVHESTPRQESVAPTRESVTPRSEPQPVAQVHESAPTHTAPPVHESVPRQESVTPSHESVPTHTTPQAHETVPTPQSQETPRTYAAAPVHESLPRQESVTPVQESVPVAQVHETAPRQEGVAPSHESVPTHSAPSVHESAPRQESVAPSHESVPTHSAPSVHESVPRQEGVAPSHTTEPTPVQQSIPRQEIVNPVAAQDTSAAHEPTPQNDPREPRPSGASAMPNLSGVLSGAGAGGGTHLDGGTRLSAGPATARPAGSEQVPGQIVPDGLGETSPTGSTTQSPVAGAPMAGGFTPGPVGGAGGHGGSGASAHAAPSATVPQQGGAKPAAATPNPAAAAGGTIRPGAGRTPETGRPVSEQAHDQLLDRQRLERQAELDRLGRATNVRDAVDQLGGTQRNVSRVRPADADRLRQDMPGMTPEQRAQELANLKPEHRRWLARDPEFVDSLKSALPAKDFAKVASELIVHVDPRAEQAASARQEAQEQVARMLQDPDTAAQLMKSGADVVIVPKDVRMPDVPGLHELRGVSNDTEAGGGRGYDDMRGSGGKHSAVTEENLLGEHTSIGEAGHYEHGYSTTTHEFSHTVHEYGLSPDDKQAITDAFGRKTKAAEEAADPKNGKDPVQWPDGKTSGNYSSRDEREYFAQATNAYLGTNEGHDPYTGDRRNNGPEWVKQHEPDLYPLLKKLYGENPSALHDGTANPVNETTAQNATYEGFREFMEHVDGTATPTGERQPAVSEHQPPAVEQKPAGAEPKATAGEQLPPPPPRAGGQGGRGRGRQQAQQAAPDTGYDHKIDSKKTFETLDRFLSDSPEFQQVRRDLEMYAREPLLDSDTAAMFGQYRNGKRQHVDVLSRNADQLERSATRIDEQLHEVRRELDNGNDAPELHDRKRQLEGAKAHLQEQRDRMAIFEHERLKDTVGGNELAVLARARHEAETRVLPGSIDRIKAEEQRNDALLAQATPRKPPAGSDGEKVHADRIKDLETRQAELRTDREQREKDLAHALAEVQKKAPPAVSSTHEGGVPAPGDKAGWKKFDETYRKAFGYSDHGVMRDQPHAEKVSARVADGKPDPNSTKKTQPKEGDTDLSAAKVNRNHVIADYMVHKYVTAAVFKARAMDEGSHRAASDAFGDFVSAMAPDRHRILDTYGRKAEARIRQGGPGEAELTRRDLTATPGTVDLRATYGNERLPGAFGTTGITDHRSADAAAKNLERELGRSGLNGPAGRELARLNDAVAGVHPDSPTPEQLGAVRDAMGAVHEKVKQQAVDDLALVNGITGPQKLDDAAAVLHAAADRSGGLSTPAQRERLAGDLEDLAGHVERAGKDPGALRALAGDLRATPAPIAPSRYREVAEQLAADRAEVRKHEVAERLSDLAVPGKDSTPGTDQGQKDVTAASKDLTARQAAAAKAEKAFDAAEAAHAKARDTADKSARDAAADPNDAQKQKKAKEHETAAGKAAAKVEGTRKALKKAESDLAATERNIATTETVRDRVDQVHAAEMRDNAQLGEGTAARVAWATADRELVARQYGGVHARAGAGENHPAGMFDRALTAHVEDVPALIEEMSASLSNSSSNLRFGDETVNKWVQNFLDPHVIREPDMLTAVAHEQLPPEVLYAPHTADLLQAVRGLEANGLVPPELRDIMAPKTQNDLEQLRTAGKLSDSAQMIVDDLDIPSPHAGKLPVSSSGDFANRADTAKLTDDRLNRLGVEGLYRPDHVPQPAPDHDVVMADASQSASHTPDGDVQMHDGTADTAQPERKRRRDDSESDSQSERDTVRRRLDDLDLTGPTPPPPPPPPPAAGGHGAATGTRGFGSPAAPPPPPPTGEGFGAPVTGQHGTTPRPSAAEQSAGRYISDRFLPDKASDLIDESGHRFRDERPGRPVDREALRAEIDALTAKRAAERGVEPPTDTSSSTAPRGTGVEHVVARDVEPMDIETPPVTAPRRADVEHVAARDVEPMDIDTPQEQPRGDRKRGRDDEEVTLRRESEPDGPQAKRQRTPAYENTDAVMQDRGYRAVGPQHELTQRLVNYLGEETKLHPQMSNTLLGHVNPHQSPVRPAEGFRPGDDMKACLENVEAYRDTHFGRPRVSGQTLHGTVEPIPGNVLWKRHDGPALFGEGPGAVGELMAKVQAGGKGSFATVLGAGPTGAGHAVALVHDRDGVLRWADLTDRRVVPARPGEMPYSFDPSWTVWASVADRHETNISGPHDPQFMERYSTFTRGEPSHDTSEPMDIDDGFGAEHATLDHANPAQAPKDAAPQPSTPQPTDRTSSGGDGPDTPTPATTTTPPPSIPGGGNGQVVGGPTRPRSASAPAELGPRTPAPAPVPTRSETVTEPRTGTGQESPSRSTSPEAVERTATPTPESVRTPEPVRAPEAEFPPPGERVPVAGDGYCLLRSVAVGAPDLAGPHQLQAAVADHFRALRPEDWPTEVVSNYRGNLLGRPDLPAGDLLAYLPADIHEAFRGMPVDELKEIVGQHLTDNAPPPSQQERAALLRTVQSWDTQWRSTGGEMLPPAAAHALGLRLRVVDHDGNTQAVFGPADGRPVTVYRASDHYDGSAPPLPRTSATEHVPPTDRAATGHVPATEHAPETDHVSVSEHVAETDHAPEAGGTSVTEHAPEADGTSATEHVQAADHTPVTPPVDETPAPTPAPTSEPTPAPAPTPQPEAVAPKPIAGTDLVVGLTGNEKAVREKVIDVIERAVPGDRAAAQAFADAHFGPATLRPMLGALSRGEVWTAPFEGGGWSGSVKLRGEVTGSTHLRTEKIEFENGADRTVATGTNRDAQWQFNVGVQARQARGIGDPAELVAYYHDRGQAEVNLDLGGMVARSKTSGPAEVYKSTMELTLDFGDLRHNGEPVHTGSADRTDRVDLDLTVAVPERPDVTSGGELRVPPQRLRDGRVGGQEIVLDLAPHGTDRNRPPVEGLLDHAEAAARQEFGGHWPALREKVLAEVDFARLQRDLKSMTAGEPVSVTLTDRRGKPVGTVDITARVGELRQVGTTKETEFNIGTTVQQVRSTSSSGGHAGQLGFSAGVKPGTGLIGGGGAGRLGRDHVEISGDARTSQLTSKSKVPGVLYDGTVHFELSFNGKPVAHDATAHDTATADVRLLVDRADTAPERNPAETSTPVSRPDGEPQLHEVVSPPDSVWHGGDDRGGLGETVVVRDLESTSALRAALDLKGRERFGEDWNAVRDQVMRGFSQPNLAARLTGMTRGEPLEVKIPGKEGQVVRAVARVEGMTYRREDGKAELNAVNETGAFSVNRRLDARTVIEQGQLGGTVAKAAKGTPGAEIGVTGSGQQRRRAGGQGRQADRVYASGKYSAPQVIYGAELVVDVHVGRPGEAGGGRPDVSVPVRVEVGLDARETVKVQAPRTEDGVIGFRRPEGAAPAVPTSARTEPAPHRAPSRMVDRHELNASYVVHTLSGADKVRAEVENAVRTKHGEPSEEVKQRIGASFDRVALKAQLSQLTRGGRITETVSGKTWSAEVTVTAKLGESTYHSAADKYEFESGTRTSSGNGNLRDSRNRLNGGGQVKVKTEVVDVTGGYAYRVDRGYGGATETVGSASNRGKHVEPAVFFDVTAPYHVEVAFKRLGVPDGVHRTDVETVARVAVPTRDAVPASGPVERTTEKLPKGFAEGRRLDSSAIVTDVHALPGATDGAPRRTLGESVLAQVESGWKPGGLRALQRKQAGQPELTRNPFGRDWAGIRGKLDAELTPDRLQSRLKAMTAGDEIVVRHGRTTVRVGAQLRDRMVHLGDAGTTEFNAGTDVQRSFAHTDATGTGHQGTLGATAAVPVPGAPAVSVTAGLTGTAGRGHDRADVQTRATSAGSASKAKVPGSAYAGEAELVFTIDRRPHLGRQVYQRRTAAIGFEALVETGETVPASATGAAGATVTVRPPEPVTVQVPPERVWETGLRDTDVLRWLGDVGGVQDLVRLRGPEYFGKSAWKEMEPVVGTVTSHSHLSALFGTATQGMGVAATLPSNRVTLGGGKGVEVGVKVVSLEHRAVDDKVELSPANGMTSGTTRNDLSAKNAGIQAQLGAKITGDVTNSPAIVGGAQHLWRDGGGHSDSGQVISNGKFAAPMARYAGHAEVEVTLFDGSRNPVKERGVVPFAVDIPLSETTGREVSGDQYLAFTEQQRAGELRVTDGAWRLDEVQRLLAPDADRSAVRTPAEHEQLLGTVRLGRAVYDREFTASTDAGAAHVRATHRLVELGGGTSEGTSALLGELLGTPDGAAPSAAEVRKVIGFVERKSAEGPVTRDDLAAGAQEGWEA
ncbi:WXG100-like domain-containing protein [Kitasatospora griseola]|uniref:WXG100-like domain-containing protein n=1 Tax=Kitasatospora griseola TaxID=2064 RepID=UPI0037FFC6AC